MLRGTWTVSWLREVSAAWSALRLGQKPRLRADLIPRPYEGTKYPNALGLQVCKQHRAPGTGFRY